MVPVARWVRALWLSQTSVSPSSIKVPGGGRGREGECWIDILVMSFGWVGLDSMLIYLMY